MKKSRLPEETQKRILEYFVAGTPARSCADLCSINKKTAWQWYHQLRTIIRTQLEITEQQFYGEVEADESYFGGKRKGKRGRGATGKVAVFGLYKRNGYVHAVSVCDTKNYTLTSIIEQYVKPDSIVYTDTYSSYDKLDASTFRHERINHSKEFVKNKNHINGIENFWRQAKRHLQKYNGVPRKHFDLYLKECEWRFNYRPTKRLYESLYTWCKRASLVHF